jgi:hypothetical protein
VFDDVPLAAQGHTPIVACDNTLLGRYEDIATKMSLSRYDLAYDYMLRTNIITPERLAAECAVLMSKHRESQLKASAQRLHSTFEWYAPQAGHFGRSHLPSLDFGVGPFRAKSRRKSRD